MKVNNVYAAEIAKWDGDKATKPFRVLWDDPESGADLKASARRKPCLWHSGGIDGE